VSAVGCSGEAIAGEDAEEVGEGADEDVDDKDGEGTDEAAAL